MSAQYNTIVSTVFVNAEGVPVGALVRYQHRIGVTITVGVYSHIYSKSMDQPGEVDNPAGGERNRQH